MASVHIAYPQAEAGIRHYAYVVRIDADGNGLQLRKIDTVALCAHRWFCKQARLTSDLHVCLWRDSAENERNAILSVRVHNPWSEVRAYAGQ